MYVNRAQTLLLQLLDDVPDFLERDETRNMTDRYNVHVRDNGMRDKRAWQTQRA